MKQAFYLKRENCCDAFENRTYGIWLCHDGVIENFPKCAVCEEAVLSISDEPIKQAGWRKVFIKEIDKCCSDDVAASISGKHTVLSGETVEAILKLFDMEEGWGSVAFWVKIEPA
jgi:hypothetical protein